MSLFDIKLQLPEGVEFRSIPIDSSIHMHFVATAHAAAVRTVASTDSVRYICDEMYTDSRECMKRLASELRKIADECDRWHP